MSSYVVNVMRALRKVLIKDLCECVLAYMDDPNSRSFRLMRLLEQYVPLVIADIILEYSEGFAGKFLRSERLDASCIAALPNDELAYMTATWPMPEIRIWTTQGTRHITHIGRRDITRITYLPSGVLALGTESGDIILYGINGTYLGTLRMHNDVVYVLIPLPNGRIASGSTDSTIRVWGIDSRVCLWTHVCDSAVFALAALPNGRLASGGTQSSTISIWHGHSLETSLQSDYIDSLVALSDGNLAAGLVSGEICVWNVELRTVIYKLGNHPRIHSLIEMPGMIISISDKGRGYVWSADAHYLMSTFKISTYYFDSVVVSGDKIVYITKNGRGVWRD